MLLIVDNYDSFIYNISHYCESAGAKTRVVRNDAATVDEVLRMADLRGLILSPGPCGPTESELTLALVRPLEGIVPILGVCLGHQAIAHAYGADIVRVPPVHGKTSLIRHHEKDIFDGLPSPLRVARYHSLAAKNVPPCLKATAHTDDGVIMALKHAVFPTYGVQFHPESVASDGGHAIIRNFIKMLA